MIIGRRGFLTMSGGVAGAGMLSATQTAQAVPMTAARSVADFGVEPNSSADQKDRLQKAIDEITASGRAVYIPGGDYRVGDWLKLPATCAIFGDPGLTRLSPVKIGGWVFAATENRELYLNGLVLDGHAKKSDGVDPITYFGLVKGGAVNITNCLFENTPGGTINAENISGTINGNTFRNCNSYLLVEGDGIRIIDNDIAQCFSGILLRGSGIVSGNVISGVTGIGLRLGGSGNENAAILATGNNISDCNIAIGVSAGGETIFASLNLITRAKEGAIRALDGDKLIGPDLARESAESYLNLTVVGNVAR